MSPWQEEKGAVLGVAEQRSSLGKRSQGPLPPVLMKESHAETEQEMINVCRGKRTRRKEESEFVGQG